MHRSPGQDKSSNNVFKLLKLMRRLKLLLSMGGGDGEVGRDVDGVEDVDEVGEEPGMCWFAWNFRFLPRFLFLLVILPIIIFLAK